MVAAPSGTHYCCKQRRLLTVQAALCLHFLNEMNVQVLLRFYLIVFSEFQTVTILSFFFLGVILTPDNAFLFLSFFLSRSLALFLACFLAPSSHFANLPVCNSTLFVPCHFIVVLSKGRGVRFE